MKAAVRYASFASGELSPRVLGRSDLPEYASGMRQMQDWIIQPQGSTTRRPGTAYIGTAKAITFPGATSQSSGTGNFNLQGVAYAAQIGTFGRWVAVGKHNGTNPVIIRSDNGGVTWTAAGTIPATNFDLQAVCWSGSLFVAVGASNGANALVFTSPDGDVWTDRSTAGGAGNITLNAVIWTGTTFVAVGAIGKCITSTTGTAWSAGTGLSGAQNYNSIATNGLELVTTALSSGVPYRSTNNGATWAATLGGSNLLGTQCMFFWNGFYYFGGTNSGTLAGVTRTSNIVNGATAVFTSATSTTTLRAFVSVGSYLCAIGDSGEFVYSADGVTWTETTIGSVGFTGAILSSGNTNQSPLAVMVGASNGANAILYTQPGNTFSRRLYPFVGSTNMPYMMEFGHLYVRFWRKQTAVQIVDTYVQSAPGTPLEIVTPWNANDLAGLQFAQANDVLYIAHPNYAPRKLTRTSEIAFTLTNLMDPTTPNVNLVTSTYKLNDGPYLDENGTVTTVTLSGTGTGSKTATASSNLWTSNDVGRVMRIRDTAAGNLWGWGIITAFSSATSVTIFMMTDPNTTNACTRWALGAWGNTPGFPAAVAFFQQRLCWGGAAAEPMSVKCSVTSAFEQYSPTQTDDTAVADNAVYFTVAAQRQSAVEWLAGELSLAVGTQGGIYFVDGGATISAAFGAPIAPGSVNIRHASNYGAEPVVPASVGDLICYVQKGGRLVRALSPETTANRYAQPNLTLLADQATRTGLLETVFAATPNMIVWGRRTDGQLVGMTLDPSTKEQGWHEHPLPGTLAGATTPLVMSVAVLPIYGHDQLYIAVRRTINGAQVEFIESLQLPFDSQTGTMAANAWYLDAATQYVGAPTTTITGLDYLDGLVVEVFGDGKQQASQTVSAGSITITSASTVLVGLGYDTLSNLETMPLRMPTRNLLSGVKSGDGAPVTIQGAILELVDTAGLAIGVGQSDTLKPIVNRLGASLTGVLTSDFVRASPIAGAGSQTGKLLATVLMQPVGPYPATLIGAAFFIEGENPNA